MYILMCTLLCMGVCWSTYVLIHVKAYAIYSLTLYVKLLDSEMFTSLCTCVYVCSGKHMLHIFRTA